MNGLESCSNSKGSLVPVALATSTLRPLNRGRKYLEIRLLNRERVAVVVNVKLCSAGDVLTFICDHLGIEDSKFFGIAVFVENEFRFLDPGIKLSKHAPKQWKSSPGWGTDIAGNPSFEVYLRVRVYVDQVELIRDDVSLYHYYHQLRENMRIQWDEKAVAEERCFEVVALALQADFGPFRKDLHAQGYFRPEHYFPPWVIQSRGHDYILQHMSALHEEYCDLECSEARRRFCVVVSCILSPVNLHLYGLRRHKSDLCNTVLLGIACRRLELYEFREEYERRLQSVLPWSRIGKVAFDRRKFYLSSLDGQKFVFFCSSEEKARYLLQFCKTFHQTLIKLQPEIVEAQKRQQEEGSCVFGPNIRESYIYSDLADLDRMQPLFCSVPSATSCQRISVVSDVSSNSNTTSGIVSDKQQTHEESENEPFDDSDGDNVLDSALSLDNPLSSSGGGSAVEISVSTEALGRPSVIGNFSAMSPGSTSFTSALHREKNGACSEKTLGGASNDDAQSIATTATMGRVDDVLDPDYATFGAEDAGSDRLRWGSSFCSVPESDYVSKETPVTVLRINETPPSSVSKAAGVEILDEANDRIGNRSRCRKLSDSRCSSSGTAGTKVSISSSKVSISELRKRTLQDFKRGEEQCVSGERVESSSEVNCVDSAVPVVFPKHEILCNLEEDSYNSNMMNKSVKKGMVSKILKSLATQTGDSLGYKFKRKGDKKSPVEWMNSSGLSQQSGRQDTSSMTHNHTNRSSSGHDSSNHRQFGAFSPVQGSLSTSNLPQDLGTYCSSVMVTDKSGTNCGHLPPRYSDAVKPKLSEGAIRPGETGEHSGRSRRNQALYRRQQRWPTLTDYQEPIAFRLPQLQQAISEPGLSNTACLFSDPSPCGSTGNSGNSSCHTCYCSISCTKGFRCPDKQTEVEKSRIFRKCVNRLMGTQRIHKQASLSGSGGAFSGSAVASKIMRINSECQRKNALPPCVFPTPPCSRSVSPPTPLGPSEDRVEHMERGRSCPFAPESSTGELETMGHCQKEGRKEECRQGYGKPKRTRRCSCCMEDHSSAKLDMSELKNLCQEMNLPLIKALCSESNLNELAFPPSSSALLETSPSASSTSSSSRTQFHNAHFHLGSRAHHSGHTMAAMGVRPSSWHECFLSCGGGTTCRPCHATPPATPPTSNSAEYACGEIGLSASVSSSALYNNSVPQSSLMTNGNNDATTAYAQHYYSTQNCAHAHMPRVAHLPSKDLHRNEQKRYGEAYCPAPLAQSLQQRHLSHPFTSQPNLPVGFCLDEVYLPPPPPYPCLPP